jgi:cytochrome P450
VIAALEPRIHALVHELVDAAVARGQQMDVATDLAAPLPLRVIADMIGIPFADRARFHRWSDAILGLSDTIGGGAGAERAVIAYRAASAEMKAYLAKAMPRRREHPADDLLSRLATAEVDGDRLSDDEILGFFQLLLVAGSETTTNLIGNAVLCFAEHPDVPARLRTTPELLPSVIEEVLRYRSPVQAMFRRTTHPIELHGQSVPADQLVLAMIGSANRDPAQFAGADRFEPTRDPNPHIAFGHGVHFCLGAPLARLEGRIAISHLLERVPRFELDGEWEPRKAFHIHGPTRLPIRVVTEDRPRRT